LCFGDSCQSPQEEMCSSIHPCSLYVCILSFCSHSYFKCGAYCPTLYLGSSQVVSCTGLSGTVLVTVPPEACYGQPLRPSDLEVFMCSFFKTGQVGCGYLQFWTERQEATAAEPWSHSELLLELQQEPSSLCSPLTETSHDPRSGE
jgi:hypothetical protein